MSGTHCSISVFKELKVRAGPGKIEDSLNRREKKHSKPQLFDYTQT